MAGGEGTYTRNTPGDKRKGGKVARRMLVLHNDDVHTFNYVTDCLIEVCGHDMLQAEQCTWLVHFKGKCDILRGGYAKLLPYRRAMADKGLKVTID